MHGGKSLQGIASPTLKTGRYSKHLPTRLLANYEAAKTDPNMLVLHDEIALVDSRIMELINRGETHSTEETWKVINFALLDFRSAYQSEDGKERADRALDKLSALITDFQHAESAWPEIQSLIEQRRKLVESERKRLVELQQVMSADQAMLMVRALVASVREHVSDPVALRAISADLERLSMARAD